jgi:hypothetical protein
MKYLLSIIILFTLLACTPMDREYSILIKNNTSVSIFFYVSQDYPDTLLPQTKQYVKIIETNNTKSFDNPHKWEDDFSTIYPKDTLLIFFFNADTINRYDWETIRKGYKIMERRAYSKGDLEKSNWTITYP